MKRKTLITIILAILIGLLVIAGVLYYKNLAIKKDQASTIVKEKLENTKGANAAEGKEYTDIELYFGGDDTKSEIIKEERLIGYDELIGEIIIQELIKGPATVSQSKPILPKETRLISFSIKDEIAYINLSNNAVFEMTSSQEEILLKAITASLSQLESVNKVMITIDNQGVETLGGNYNISKPFSSSDISGLKISK